MCNNGHPGTTNLLVNLAKFWMKEQSSIELLNARVYEIDKQKNKCKIVYFMLKMYVFFRIGAQHSKPNHDAPLNVATLMNAIEMVPETVAETLEEGRTIQTL
mmetsp:Transcript_34459/g.50534  ORF Transcript_34459/g.50534 Transcript_34459/m.50534 type:complete len:102 (-) Transcript_34459:289-594(-)